MALLSTIYWATFAAGLVYIVVAGAMGAISGGIEGGHGDVGLDVDHDADFDIDTDVDIDTDLDLVTDFDVDTDLDLDVDTGLDADIDLGTTDLGAEVEAHAGHGGAHMGHEIGNVADFPGFSLLSPLSIAGFTFAFGGMGLVSQNYKMSLLPGLGIATAGGVLMMVLMWLIIGKLIYSMQGSSEAHEQDMVGLEAEVITPMGDDVTGEIAYILGGTRYTAPARLESKGRVAKHETVRIRRVKENIYLVARKKKLLN